MEPANTTVETSHNNPKSKYFGSNGAISTVTFLLDTKTLKENNKTCKYSPIARNIRNAVLEARYSFTILFGRFDWT